MSESNKTVQQPKTVQQWLEEVDYSELDGYIPSEFAIGYVNFIKLVNGVEGEENKTPIIHYKMADSLISGDRQIANMIFRGAAKSTFLGEYFFLYLAVFGELPNLS